MTSTTTSALSTAQQHGLPVASITAIQPVLAAHPEVEPAILYGSRAMGTRRPTSDIDLTLTGSTLTTDGLAPIDADLDDLLLPYMMDLSCLTSITHPPLLEHIQRVGQVLYSRIEYNHATPTCMDRVPYPGGMGTGTGGVA
jgi:predicted nucleotidyltransferase